MTDLSRRVLVLTASRKDAASTAQLLFSAKITCERISSFDELLTAIESGAGSVIIAKEVLNEASVQRLKEYLDKQPKWSFIPIILLAAAGDLNKGSSAIVRLLRPIRNLTLLERPVRASTLISIARASLADRQRQYEVRDLLTELEAARVKAIAASEAKSSFLANMSHEIRTPLGIILGFSDFLADSETPADEKIAYAETIRRNGKLLSGLIDDVLDLAKVEAGHMTIEKAEVAPRDLLADVLAAMQPKAFTRKIALSLSVMPEVPWIIKTDAIRLKQVLINVIGNALKFTSQGGVSIAVDYANEKLRISVADTGIGISLEQTKALFSAFSQADGSITRRFGGTGLGLVLSKRIAEALGGDLVLKKSVPGEGSEFEISVDVGPSLNVTLQTPRGAPTFVDMKGKSILVVDDSKDNQILISRILKNAKFSVETVDDGQQAIDRLEEKRFDAVLMDVQMPRLDGYEAVSILRKNGYKHPIIALTAHAFKEDRDRAFKAGFDEYLTKPIDREHLMRLLSQIIL